MVLKSTGNALIQKLEAIYRHDFKDSDPVISTGMQAVDSTRMAQEGESRADIDASPSSAYPSNLVIA